MRTLCVWSSSIHSDFFVRQWGKKKLSIHTRSTPSSFSVVSLLSEYRNYTHFIAGNNWKTNRRNEWNCSECIWWCSYTEAKKKTTRRRRRDIETKKKKRRKQKLKQHTQQTIDNHTRNAIPNSPHVRIIITQEYACSVHQPIHAVISMPMCSAWILWNDQLENGLPLLVLCICLVLCVEFNITWSLEQTMKACLLHRSCHLMMLHADHFSIWTMHRGSYIVWVMTFYLLHGKPIAYVRCRTLLEDHARLIKENAVIHWPVEHTQSHRTNVYPIRYVVCFEWMSQAITTYIERSCCAARYILRTGRLFHLVCSAFSHHNRGVV